MRLRTAVAAGARLTRMAKTLFPRSLTSPVVSPDAAAAAYSAFATFASATRPTTTCGPSHQMETLRGDENCSLGRR